MPYLRLFSKSIKRTSFTKLSMEKNNILTKDQIALLEKIGSTPYLQKHFYLTGGTLLAAFYLKHRYSEDLDFFSEQEIDAMTLQTFFKSIKEELNILEVDYQQSFNRNLFFLKLKSGVLKTEFTYFPFSRIEKGGEQFGVSTDSLLDIAVNKLFTIYQRTKARDYIDLFYICKEDGLNILELVKKVRVKFETHIDLLQLGSQFIKAEEAEDFPRMIKKVKPAEWRYFFLQEAKKLRDEVVK